MGTTPNYSWPYPAATDPVANGAQDIQDLASDADTTVRAVELATVMRFADAAARTTALSGIEVEGMLTFLQDTDAVEYYDGSAWAAVGGAGGLVPLVTEDFTSVSAVNIDNVFTADYRAYKIVLRQTNISTNTTMLLRLRASGVSKTANYQTERFYGYGSNVAASTDPTGTDDWYLGNLNTTYPDRYMFEGTLFDPYNTNVKMGVAQVTMREASVFTSMNLGLTLDDTSLCDGISVFPGAGTFSGTITIYGMTEAT